MGSNESFGCTTGIYQIAIQEFDFGNKPCPKFHHSSWFLLREFLIGMLTPSATLGLEGLHSSKLPFPSQEQQHPPTAVRPLRRRMLLATTCAVTAPKLWQSVKGGEGQRKEIEWDCKFGTTIFFWWLFRGAATRESPAKADCNSIMLHFVPMGTKKKCRCSRKNASSCLCWQLCPNLCEQHNEKLSPFLEWRSNEISDVWKLNLFPYALPCFWQKCSSLCDESCESCDLQR